MSSPPAAPYKQTLELGNTRASTACKVCRARKVKCIPGSTSFSSIDSSQTGPCMNCLQAGSGDNCTYPVSKDRAAFTRQYVQNLEARVQALETLCQRFTPIFADYEAEKTQRGNKRQKVMPRMSHEANISSLTDPVESTQPSFEARHVDAATQHRVAAGEANLPVGGEATIKPDGKWTQDELGNYRWLGPHNTLSILDSFSPESSNPSPTTTPAGAATGVGPSHTSSYAHGSSHGNGFGIGHTERSNTNTNTNAYFEGVEETGLLERLLPLDKLQFPEEKVALEMIDAFYSDVHPILPVVPEHRFRPNYTRMMDRHKRGDPVDDVGFVSVAFAIFALGERVLVTSRAWQRRRSTAGHMDYANDTSYPEEVEAGVQWFERAEILHYLNLRNVNHFQVYCLTLLAAFQASVNRMPRAWLLASQALRVAQDLGLHRATAQHVTFHQKQSRSRCWWTVYGMDRLLSLSLGRPLGVEDIDVDVPYPLLMNDATLKRCRDEGIDEDGLGDYTEPYGCAMSGFVALTKLCKIGGEVAHLLHRPSMSVDHLVTAVDELDKQLEDWLANHVPTKYKTSSSTRSIQIVSAVLSNTYFAILITLHRDFLPSNPNISRPGPPPPPNAHSVSRCLQAARSFIHSAATQRVLVPPSHHVALTCQYLWSSGIILLLCRVQATDQVIVEAIDPLFDSCKRSLEALEPVWPGSRKLRKLLLDADNRARGVRSPLRHRLSPHRSTRTHGSPRTETPNNSGQNEREPANPPHPSEANIARTNNYTAGHRATFELDPTVPLQLETGVADLNMELGQLPTPHNDGIELLQSFFTGTGLDAAAFWATLGNMPTINNTSETNHINEFGSSHTHAHTHDTTSTYAANHSWMNTNTGMTDYEEEQQQNGRLAAELWNFAGGGEFQWTDDLNMPFNH
ncbi:hypothetical protein CI109_102741 [Kwoniella shandongensis]|uniref:Uncharacterized protein n=1 Tax=Kwoniella shandongensis TaxID=1734106 RepID=A0A5M6BVE7_9TREE|nr:uncharacterized protein CI109_004936 [Kwoniella shandongensis]KAA5526733.1 hypothetical protein CI109_004936 [Kwoniella shandongensis]